MCSLVARHGASLEKIDHTPGRRPVQFEPVAEHLLAAYSENVQLSQNLVAKSQRSAAVLGNRLFDSTAFDCRAQRDVLLSGRTSQHTASCIERVVVGYDEARHDGLS